MLFDINQRAMHAGEQLRPMHEPSLYDRNELKDMQTALDLLYEFKDALARLHPNSMRMIVKMVSERY